MNPEHAEPWPQPQDPATDLEQSPPPSLAFPEEDQAEIWTPDVQRRKDELQGTQPGPEETLSQNPLFEPEAPENAGIGLPARQDEVRE